MPAVCSCTGNFQAHPFFLQTILLDLKFNRIGPGGAQHLSKLVSCPRLASLTMLLDQVCPNEQDVLHWLLARYVCACVLCMCEISLLCMSVRGGGPCSVLLSSGRLGANACCLFDELPGICTRYTLYTAIRGVFDDRLTNMSSHEVTRGRGVRQALTAQSKTAAGHIVGAAVTCSEAIADQDSSLQ